MNESARTYHIPFERVWVISSSLAGGALKRWKIVSRDDIEGVIHAEAKSFLTRSIHPIVIRVTLDENAQTVVKVEAESRRRIERFFRALDRRLQTPVQR